MKTSFQTMLALAALLVSGAQISTSAQEIARNGLKINAKDVVEYQNITIYPIRATSSYVELNKALGVYGTLNESMESGALKITEITQGDGEIVEDQAQVNSLMAQNLSGDTIFVMAGEVVTGGKQDRVIAQDLLILPGEEKDLSVYCVEQGRWSPEGADAGEAEAYEFRATKSVASNSIRDKSEQSEVWQNVSMNLEAVAMDSESDNYNDLKNNEEYQLMILDYKMALEHGLKDDDIVGVIAVTGNKILACDIFHKNEQFDKLSASLIESFANDAYVSGEWPTVEFEAIGLQFEQACKLLDSDESNSDKHKQLKNGGRTIHAAKFE